MVSALIGLVWGLAIGYVFANRYIDHRWYCGSWHPANHPCSPKEGYLERRKQRNEALEKADRLEAEALRLRRGA